MTKMNGSSSTTVVVVGGNVVVVVVVLGAVVVVVVGGSVVVVGGSVVVVGGSVVVVGGSVVVVGAVVVAGALVVVGAGRVVWTAALVVAGASVVVSASDEVDEDIVVVTDVSAARVTLTGGLVVVETPPTSRSRTALRTSISVAIRVDDVVPDGLRSENAQAPTANTSSRIGMTRNAIALISDGDFGRRLLNGEIMPARSRRWV